MRSFDFSLLNGSAGFVRERIGFLREQIKVNAEGLIVIGNALLEIKEAVPYGMFGKILKAEFGWSRMTANRYMKVAKKFGSCNKLLQLAPAVLRILSDDDVPKEAIDEVMERSESGEAINGVKAAAIVDSHQRLAEVSAAELAATKEPEQKPRMPYPVPDSPESPPPKAKKKPEPAATTKTPTKKETIAKIMALVETLDEDSRYEVVEQVVATLHSEDRAELFGKLNAKYKTGHEKQVELFCGDPADLKPPKKIDTPEVREAWASWCRSNHTKGRPITVEEGRLQLKSLGLGKAKTAVARIEYALAQRMETIPLAKELPNDFEHPELESVQGYADAMKIPREIAQDFFTYYARQGWVLGNGRLMDDWKQSLHHWAKQQKERKANQPERKKKTFEELEGAYEDIRNSPEIRIRGKWKPDASGVS